VHDVGDELVGRFPQGSAFDVAQAIEA
jgi:hypothetical protein